MGKEGKEKNRKQTNPTKARTVIDLGKCNTEEVKALTGENPTDNAAQRCQEVQKGATFFAVLYHHWCKFVNEKDTG